MKNVTLNKKISIYIYPDLTAFHKVIGQPNVPSWAVASAGQDNDINMVSPLNSGGSHSYNEMIQVVVHEFTHVIVSNINPDINSVPIWLNEGAAEFEAKQMSDAYKAVLKNMLQKNYYPTLNDLKVNSFAFGNDGGYQYSYTIVEYIVKNYGYEKLKDLIKSPSNFENVLGISEGEFPKRWSNYLNQNYK